MGKAIIAAIVALAIIGTIAYVVIRMAREAKEASQAGDLKQERALRRLVDDAALTLRSIGPSGSIEDTDVLSSRSTIAVERWLHRYDTYTNHQKEINA
jgi:hypothetical protein